MSLMINTPQGKISLIRLIDFIVHLIGEVKGAHGFDTNRLFCKVRYKIKF